MTEQRIPPLLTTKHVAEILRMSEKSVKKNVSSNPSAIPKFLKLGAAKNSGIRFRLQDVEQFIQDQLDANN